MIRKSLIIEGLVVLLVLASPVFYHGSNSQENKNYHETRSTAEIIEINYQTKQKTHLDGFNDPNLLAELERSVERD